jgi:protein-tyrosine kinase
VSKIEASIQKAKQGSKTDDRDRGSGRRPLGQSGRSDQSEKKAEVLQLYKTAKPDRVVMEDKRLVTEIEDRTAISAYKIMRTRVLQRMRSNNWRSLLVTSAGATEGKSLTAANLALSIARDSSQSVLLVDLDLQRSKTAEYFGIRKDVDSGISDYLIGEATIPDIVYSLEGIPRMSIIPNRSPVEDSSDELSGHRMRELLEWVKYQSDKTIVIFDMPPVLAGDDVLMLVPEIDAVLMVVTQGKTERTLLEKAMGLLADVNVLGVVLNGCSETTAESAYGYY